MKDSPNLDLLRTYAVTLVVLSHMPDVLGWTWNTRAFGHVGVALFFVHTTLVLMQSLERHGADPLPFYVRRIFRIYPLAVATVLLIAGLLWVAGNPLSGAEVTSNVLLLQHVAGHMSYPYPLWTLPYELQMYLLLPAIFAVTHAARSAGRLAALYAIGLAPALALWCLSINGVFSISFIPCFLPGVIAFALMKRVPQCCSPWLLVAVVVGSSAAVPLLGGPSFTGAANSMAGAQDVRSWEMPLLWGMCLLVGIAIALCREVTSAPLQAIGSIVARYSYSIYLTHVMVTAVTLATPGPWYSRLAQFLALQAAVSILAYRLIEAPGIRFGVRLAGRLSDRRPLFTLPGSAPPDPAR